MGRLLGSGMQCPLPQGPNIHPNNSPSPYPEQLLLLRLRHCCCCSCGDVVGAVLTATVQHFAIWCAWKMDKMID